MNMRGKKFCAIFASIINLIYAIALTAVVFVAIFAGVIALLDINSGGSDLTAGIVAIAGALLLLIAIVAVIAAVLPCILMWISSIGMLRRCSKSESPAGFAVLSIIAHVLLFLGGIGGAAALYFNDGGILIIAAAAVSVVSLIIIIFSAIGCRFPE